MWQLPYDDTVVITAKIEDSIVKRLLVDTGSSCDVLFLSDVEQMEIDSQKSGGEYQAPGRSDWP